MGDIVGEGLTVSGAELATTVHPLLFVTVTVYVPAADTIPFARLPIIPEDQVKLNIEPEPTLSLALNKVELSEHIAFCVKLGLAVGFAFTVIVPVAVAGGQPPVVVAV